MPYHNLPSSPILSGMFVGFDGIMKSFPNPRRNTWKSHGNAVQLYWNIVGTRIAHAINVVEREVQEDISKNGTTKKG